MKTHKFKYSDDFDSDGYYEAKRTIIGRLTPLRFNILKNAVRKFNYLKDAPYGRSPNGYAYRCGCVHDCCGHLIREHISFDFNSIADNLVELTFIHSQSYNL